MRRVASLIFPLEGVSGRGKPPFLARFRLGQDARCAGRCEKRHWLLSTEHTFQVNTQVVVTRKRAWARSQANRPEVISLRLCLDRLMGANGKFEDTSHLFSSQEYTRFCSLKKILAGRRIRFYTNTCASLVYHSRRERGKRSVTFASIFGTSLVEDPSRRKEKETMR